MNMDNDTICLASQLGRLDFVSALLAVVAIFLALAALPYYFFVYFKVKGKSLKIVKQKLSKIEIENKRIIDNFLKEVREDIELYIIKEMEAKIPILATQYFEITKNTVNSDIANLIANSQNLEDEEND